MLTPGPERAFGKPWGGTGGTSFSGGCYEGALCGWVLSPHAWTEVELVEYFSVPSDELETLDLWDKVSSFIVPGFTLLWWMSKEACLMDC